jgi:tRNA 2-thiouridine synthesizing protein A
MLQTDLTNLAIAKVVDARGNTCPGPLLEAKKGIGQVKVGEVLEIKSSDTGSRKDIPAWAGKVGHDYLGFLEAEEHDRLFIARKI